MAAALLVSAVAGDPLMVGRAAAAGFPPSETLLPATTLKVTTLWLTFFTDMSEALTFSSFASAAVNDCCCAALRLVDAAATPETVTEAVT
jgi:hypothetical protein